MTSTQNNSMQRPETAAASPWAIELTGINKRFGAVHANKNIDLKIKRGTVHGIVGVRAGSEDGERHGQHVRTMAFEESAQAGTIASLGQDHQVRIGRVRESRA